MRGQQKDGDVVREVMAGTLDGLIEKPDEIRRSSIAGFPLSRPALMISSLSRGFRPSANRRPGRTSPIALVQRLPPSRDQKHQSDQHWSTFEYRSSVGGFTSNVFSVKNRTTRSISFISARSPGRGSLATFRREKAT
jgi:hypothetical protein